MKAFFVAAKQHWQWRHLLSPRLLLWYSMMALLFLTDSACFRYHDVLITTSSAHFTPSFDALRVPLILGVGAILGLALSWKKRSLLSGAYIFVCLLLTLVFLPMLALRGAWHVTITPDAITARTLLPFWGTGTVNREAFSHIETATYRVKGQPYYYPVLIRSDGSKLRITPNRNIEFHVITELHRLWQLSPDHSPPLYNLHAVTPESCDRETRQPRY